MNKKDKERIRFLASYQTEVSHSAKNIERVELWKKHHSFKGSRPPIHIEVDTFLHEAVEPLLQCEEPEARAIEQQLIRNVINLDTFDDDKVVPPYYQVGFNTWFNLFGHSFKYNQLKNEDGTAMGIRHEHIVGDLADDFDKITSPSNFGVDKAGTQKKIDMLNDLFGDILPVKLVSHCLYAVPTQKVVYMMGMENMLYAMYDYPDKFKEMMDRIADEYIAYFKYLEREKALLQTNAFEFLGQGSMCFWDEEKIHGSVKTEDVWGFMDSQETVTLSPEMYHEFIFPCYKKISDIFGRLSYGCCEPVNPVWNDVKTLKNLKKVSISPWCDEDYMAEQLRGADIIYHRKPDPKFLGVGTVLDEDAFREHIKKTLTTARGCHLEIAQRDVYTVNNDLNKAKRYVEIIRESIDKYWQQ